MKIQNLSISFLVIFVCFCAYIIVKDSYREYKEPTIMYAITADVIYKVTEEGLIEADETDLVYIKSICTIAESKRLFKRIEENKIKINNLESND